MRLGPTMTDVSASPARELTIDDLVRRVDDALATVCAPEALKVPALAGLVDAIRYSLLAPGKRIRPVLMLAAAECGDDAVLDQTGTQRDDVALVAAAIECIHAYSLVHDDLPGMDDDDLRRGMPTSHRRFGEATAILVGDALQTEAFSLIARADSIAADIRIRIIDVLARAAGFLGMVGGQYLDMQAVHRASDMDAMRDMHGRKTGALISASTEIGALLGGVGRSAQRDFATFGRELGWLFQIVDDLLDATGDEVELGKPVGSDERQGKVTAVQTHGGVDGLRRVADEQAEACLAAAAALPRAGGRLPQIVRFVRARNH